MTLKNSTWKTYIISKIIGTTTPGQNGPGRVIAMNGFSTLHRVLELELHYQRQFSVLPGVSPSFVVGLTLLQSMITGQIIKGDDRQ